MKVGPVLQSGPTAAAIAAAIHDLNDQVEETDRGSYVRVTAPDRCRVTREAIEARLGRAFRLRSELELVMSSFAGRLILDEDEAQWVAK